MRTVSTAHALVVGALLTGVFATANGVRLHYVSAGAGRLMLFIHGWPEFWLVWRKVIGPLSERFDVVAEAVEVVGQHVEAGLVQPPLEREDVVSIMETLFDLRRDTQRILALLEEDDGEETEDPEEDNE